MKIGAIVQSRMSSQRFFGKALHPVAGKPLLQYLLERLSHCQEIDRIVICTSSDKSDEPIAAFCEKHGVDCYRGSLGNVASRYKETLERYRFDGFVRVNGDSPLLDHGLIDRGVEIFRAGDFDAVTNALGRTYPSGQGVEVFRADTFLRNYPLLRGTEALEHVTKYLYEHLRESPHFRIFNLISDEDYHGIRLAVDTAEDMETFAAIVAKMDKPHWKYGLRDIAGLYREVTRFHRPADAWG